MRTARLYTLLTVVLLLGIFLGALMGSIGFGVVAGSGLSIAMWLAARHLHVRNRDARC
jgi:hypothetical protein